MEPVTHALASLAVARAGQRRLPRFGAIMLVAAGVAPDLDYASYIGGAGAFLRLQRTLLHCIVGGAALAIALAFAFRALDREFPQADPRKSGLGPLELRAALAVCAVGVAVHLALDLVTGVGVQLFWPFYRHWYGADLAANLDPWILLLLIAGLLLPELFRLIGEEVGSRKPGARRGVAAAAITLVLLAVYFGVRADLRDSAVDLLLSREYHRREPLSARAYPASDTPFRWRGVVVTDNTLEAVEVPVNSPDDFDPNESLSQYKPDDSPALRIARNDPLTALYLRYARDPLATVESYRDGYRFEVHDLRFASDDRGPDNIFLRIDYDSLLRIKDEGFHFAASPGE